MGRGHRDDLSLIGGIGQDLLVTGHCRVKHDFPHRLPVVSEGAALEAAALLAGDGIEVTVVNARFAKPLDAAGLLSLAARSPRMLTIEEHVIAGGFGSAVGELFAERGARVDLEMLGIPDEWVDHGAQKVWRHRYGLDAEGIAAAVRRRWPQLIRSDEAERTAG